MASQSGWTVEASRADLAGVAFLVVVDPQVGLHVRFGAEVLGTDFAQERPDALVFDFVAEKGFTGRELLVTLIAREIEVNGDVIAETTFTGEPGRTLRAEDGLLAGMDNEMGFEGCRIAEGFGTGIAEEGTLAGVRSEMIFKDETASEDFVAGWTLVDLWLPLISLTRFFRFVFSLFELILF